MQVLSYTEFRKNLASALDYVEDTHAPVIVKRGKNSAVVISLDDYNSVMETLHLMSNPITAKRLSESIEQYKQHKTKQRELIDA